MKLSARLFLVLALIILSGFLVVATTQAKSNTLNIKPGWGYGDNNHVHTGPPGHSVRPVRDVREPRKPRDPRESRIPFPLPFSNLFKTIFG